MCQLLSTNNVLSKGLHEYESRLILSGSSLPASTGGGQEEATQALPSPLPSFPLFLFLPFAFSFLFPFLSFLSSPPSLSLPPLPPSPLQSDCQAGLKGMSVTAADGGRKRALSPQEAETGSLFPGPGSFPSADLHTQLKAISDEWGESGRPPRRIPRF